MVNVITKSNIVQRVKSGTPTGLLNHKKNNKNGVLSIRFLHYGKVHENRESVSGAEIPSKLNCEYLKNYAESNEHYHRGRNSLKGWGASQLPSSILKKDIVRTIESCDRDGVKFRT